MSGHDALERVLRKVGGWVPVPKDGDTARAAEAIIEALSEAGYAVLPEQTPTADPVDLGCPICKAEEYACEVCRALEGEEHEPTCPEATDPYAPDTIEEARGER